MRVFALFEAFAAMSWVKTIETQTNDVLLSLMLHTYAGKIETGAILFEDAFQTAHCPLGAEVRPAVAEDRELLAQLELDDGAKWVLTVNHELAGAGGVLYHYNHPYGDVYMKVAEAFRGRGYGAYLVQELKAAGRRAGKVPAARCNVRNEASRRTLQKAGFVPRGNLLAGKL